ncbi:uncharacterized protein LOC144344887 isoform X2 [Saccoglossus kowalevskii]
MLMKHSTTLWKKTLHQVLPNLISIVVLRFTRLVEFSHHGSASGASCSTSTLVYLDAQTTQPPRWSTPRQPPSPSTLFDLNAQTTQPPRWSTPRQPLQQQNSNTVGYAQDSQTAGNLQQHVITARRFERLHIV